jgi:hypothetical protein
MLTKENFCVIIPMSSFVNESCGTVSREHKNTNLSVGLLLSIVYKCNRVCLLLGVQIDNNGSI